MISIEPKQINSLLLLLLGFSAQGWAEAGDPGQKPDPPRTVDAGGEMAGNPVGDPSKVIVAEPVRASYVPLTGKERWNLYLRNAFWSPGVFFKAAGPVLGGQLNNEPAAGLITIVTAELTPEDENELQEANQ